MGGCGTCLVPRGARLELYFELNDAPPLRKQQVVHLLEGGPHDVLNVAPLMKALQHVRLIDYGSRKAGRHRQPLS